MIKAKDIERFVHAPLFFSLDTFCSGLYLELSCFVLSHSTPTCGENPSPLDEKPPALYAIFIWTGSDLLGKNNIFPFHFIGIEPDSSSIEQTNHSVNC